MKLLVCAIMFSFVMTTSRSDQHGQLVTPQCTSLHNHAYQPNIAIRPENISSSRMEIHVRSRAQNEIYKELYTPHFLQQERLKNRKC
jgi:uncharacterized protein YcfL